MTLLYHPAGYKSAPSLAEAVGLPALRHSDAEDFGGGVLVRWGSYRRVPISPSVEVNTREALRAYRNRLEQLTLLRDGGVRVPDFTSSHDEAESWISDGSLIVGRSFPKGRQLSWGRGFNLYFSGVLSPRDLYMKYIPKSREFRVHVFEPTGQTRTRELVHDSEIELDHEGHLVVFEPNMEVRLDEPVWNLKTDFTYRYVQGSRPNGVISQARRAIKALGLDFGAVDIITDASDKPYVLEVNTAPGLADPTLAWYAKQLSNLLEVNNE